MLATEVDGFGQWVATTPLASDPIWTRPLKHVSELEFTLFFARAACAGQRELAIAAMDRLQTDLVLTAVAGRTQEGDLRIIGYDLPLSRFTTDDFVDGLVKLSTVRRAATLYALLTRQEPHVVAELTWQEVGGRNSTPERELEILRARSAVRHLKLPYVFWEWASESVASPLLDLRADAEQAFGQAWPRLQRQYDAMVSISSRADSAHLLGLVEEIQAGHL